MAQAPLDAFPAMFDVMLLQTPCAGDTHQARQFYEVLLGILT